MDYELKKEVGKTFAHFLFNIIEKHRDSEFKSEILQKVIEQEGNDWSHSLIMFFENLEKNIDTQLIEILQGIRSFKNGGRFIAGFRESDKNDRLK